MGRLRALQRASRSGTLIAAGLLVPMTLWSDDEGPIAIAKCSISQVLVKWRTEAVEDEHGVLTHAVTSPYQAGTTHIRVLVPRADPPQGGFPVVYVLPVEAGQETHWGDGLLEVARANLHTRHGVICVAPSFSHLPWYANHPSDPKIRQETYFLKVVVPFVEKSYAVRSGRGGRLLLGFSKSGWGAFSLLLRHPDLFERAAAWDAPLTKERPDAYGMGPIFGSQENFQKYAVLKLLEKRACSLRGARRLALLGYGNFRDHHQALHERLEALAIPHQYRDGPERRHRWDSGWLPGAVAFVAGTEPARR